MYALKWQNNSGDWFSSTYAEQDYEMVCLLYNWKTTGGVAKVVELWDNTPKGDTLVMKQEKK